MRFFQKLLTKLLVFLSSIVIHSQEVDFHPPIDAPFHLSGTFGEFRSRFHTGIDFKGGEGIKIFSIEDGYISRIEVSPYSYGKVVYITHPNGYSSVYAHLSKFSPDIEEYIKSEQYRSKSFTVKKFPKKDKIQIKRGELLGYSGNTGRSFGAHLHFEIRDTKSQKIINPMLFGLPILDRSEPIINSILIYFENGKKELKKVKKLSNDQYSLENNLIVTEPFNIAVSTIDILDAAPNKCGVYSIELYVNDSLFFFNEMTTFSFGETKYINSHIDYEYYKNNNIKMQKCFLDLNNKISTNKKHTSHPIGTFLKDGTHKITLIVKDSYQNTSSLEFYATFQTKSKTKKTHTLSSILINSKQVFEFKKDDCKIYIPNNSLYKDYLFTFKKTHESNMTYPIYTIMNDSIPSHRNFIISIEADSIEEGLRPYAIIGRFVDGEIQYVNSKWQDNTITGYSSYFGDFTIYIDTIKPTIKDLSYYNQSNHLMDNKITFQISDNVSGIDEYRAELDGNWILMEYDYKTGLIEHTIEQDNMIKKQTLTLSVSDKAGNTRNIIADILR